MLNEILKSYNTTVYKVLVLVSLLTILIPVFLFEIILPAFCYNRYDDINGMLIYKMLYTGISLYWLQFFKIFSSFVKLDRSRKCLLGFFIHCALFYILLFHIKVVYRSTLNINFWLY